MSFRSQALSAAAVNARQGGWDSEPETIWPVNVATFGGFLKTNVTLTTLDVPVQMLPVAGGSQAWRLHLVTLGGSIGASAFMIEGASKGIGFASNGLTQPLDGQICIEEVSVFLTEPGTGPGPITVWLTYDFVVVPDIQ